MWGGGKKGVVAITVHVATCSRCSLLDASDPLSRSLSEGVELYISVFTWHRRLGDSSCVS